MAVVPLIQQNLTLLAIQGLKSWIMAPFLPKCMVISVVVNTLKGEILIIKPQAGKGFFTRE